MAMKPSSAKEMIFLHGIRALSIMWIVICHTYAFFMMAPTMNSNDYFLWVQKVSSMFFLSGFYGVDTFFLLSAMLLSLSVFNELDRT
jgi:peptidoglycan/LPS O-acetylase OafA/YrhL